MLEEQEEQARLYEQRINRPAPQRRNSRPLQPGYQSPPGGGVAQGGPNQSPMAEIQDTITKAAEGASVL